MANTDGPLESIVLAIDELKRAAITLFDIYSRGQRRREWLDTYNRLLAEEYAFCVQRGVWEPMENMANRARGSTVYVHGDLHGRFDGCITGEPEPLPDASEQSPAAELP